MQPKTYEGLRFKNLNHMNNDLLMKISWSTVYSPNTFWIRVISTKYGVDFHNIPIELSIKYGSYL